MDDLVHGGALATMAQAFPDAPLPWIDLSTGINPWSYPVTNLSQSAWQNLPDHDAMTACMQALGDVVKCDGANIVLTPGSSAAMMAVANALGIEHVALMMPTYGGYSEAFQTIEVVPNLEAALASNSQAIVLGNPNNPDGMWQDRAMVKDMSARLAAQGRWLIIDEAFGDVAPHKCMATLAGLPGLLVLRSFGKFYGLAGLRLGAVLGPIEAVAKIRLKLGSWPISGPALEIGARAYRDKAWQKQMSLCLYVEAEALSKLLAEAGLMRLGGTALFQLVSTPDAHAVWQKLARAGVYVRRFSWSNQVLRFGLPRDANASERLRLALQA